MKLTTAVIVISDRSFRKEREDLTGPELIKQINKSNIYNNLFYSVVPDDEKYIIDELKKNIKNQINLIITCGGTGFSKRDNTPEATLKIINKNAEGIMEYLRMKNYLNNKNSYLSRGICGIAENSIIINFPGSPGGARDSFSIIKNYIIHPIKLLIGNVNDCKIE